MTSVPLVETTRGGTVENVHFGSVAVVDHQGRLLWSAGDPDYLTFTRSALKPFQALPFVLDDGPGKLGFSQQELAIMCASHSGEQVHVDTVRGILAKVDLDETDLECGCQTPLYYDFLHLRPPNDVQWSPLQHNCSGKHAGFLSWCRLHGAPTRGYTDPLHPLQQQVRGTLAATLGVDAAALPGGIDGCSAPNYAVPLARLAQLYARLAQGARDAQWGSAFGDLRDAMVRHPDLVSGTARTDLMYMQAGGGDWVAKVGADAVQAIGITSEKIGIAVKIADGATRALHTAVVSVLDQLGLLDDERARIVESYRQPALRNWRGLAVGEIRPVFRLARAGS